MKIKVKCNLRIFHRRLMTWGLKVDQENAESLKEYGQIALQSLVRATPPANGRITVSKALKALRQRIKEDWEGHAPIPYTDANLVWRRSKNGSLYARISYKDADGHRRLRRPSLFRVFTGRMSAEKLRALQADDRTGRVPQLVHNPLEHVTNSGDYRMRKIKGSLRLRGLRRDIALLRNVRSAAKTRLKHAGKLMAGWKALAAKVGAKLPSAVQRQQGSGSASMKKDHAHKAVLTAVNKGKFDDPEGLQPIVDRQVPFLNRKFKKLAKKRAALMGKKLK